MKNIWTLLGIIPCLLSVSFTKVNRAATPKAATRYYDSTKLLDFSDSNSTEVDAYYGDIGERKGDELLRYLYARISCPSEDLDKYYLDYGSGLKGVGQWYQITDRNWKISETITPETFTFITKNTDTRCKNTYFYSMYISDEANNNPKKAINNFLNGYTKDTSLDHIDYANKKKPNTTIQIDKEHVWAKNHGFKVKQNGSDTFVKGAPTDLHHLIAADHNTNSAGHNDYFYGDVNHETSTAIYAYLADGTTELSGYLDTSTETFEPTDEWKGDVARSLFYMATRYSVKKDQNTQAEPYLKITDDRSYQDDSNVTFHGVQYNLTTLLEWNEKDPVSEYEYHRNNLIYKNVQNNRNPYVDHPEWVRRVFAPDTMEGSIFDAIDKKTYTGRIGSNITLDLNLDESTDYTAEYDESFLSVDKNVVTLKKEGSTVLTFKETKNGISKSYTCTFDILPVATFDKIQIDNPNVIIGKDNGITATQGDSFQLSVSFRNLLSGERLSYQSSDETIAEVSATGLVTTKKTGTCTIDIYLNDPSARQRKKAVGNVSPIYQIQLTVNKKKAIVEIDGNGNFSILGLSSRMSYLVLIVIAIILLIIVILIIIALVHKSEKKKKTSMKKASKKKKK